MINRINELDTNIPLTAIYGGISWMPKTTREEFEYARNGEGYSRSRVSSFGSKLHGGTINFYHLFIF